uniref:DUF4316 domain-containing protein n=1 Tax=Panagrellus redivivus TaxID=6233 RepID=A0A7E4W3P3_PANRE
MDPGKFNLNDRKHKQLIGELEQIMQDMQDELTYYRRAMVLSALLTFNNQSKETYEAALIRLGYAKDSEDLNRKVDDWVEQKRRDYALHQEALKKKEEKKESK